MTKLERAGLRALIAEEYHKAEKEHSQSTEQLNSAKEEAPWCVSERLRRADAKGRMRACETILGFLAEE